MRVHFRNPKQGTYSQDEAFYVSPSQIFLSTVKDYEVHAVSVYDKIAFVQIVDDNDTPIFLPRVLFDVIDPCVPDDWICNVFPDGPVQLVVGPPFVAKDLISYNAMIDQEGAQVERFWRRIESRGQGAD
jgi:hypothetical protein